MLEFISEDSFALPVWTFVDTSVFDTGQGVKPISL